ncbi:MAG: hypothetical protein MZU79_01640, partial [Anaerotruncus sp.]|nr:hypothetical protein [Anaerotruncus sp.]
KLRIAKVNLVTGTQDPALKPIENPLTRTLANAKSNNFYISFENIHDSILSQRRTKILFCLSHLVYF